MKKNYFLFLFAFVLSANCILAQSWTALSSGTTETLYGIVPTTVNNALSVGDNQILVKTSNQGAFWTQQLIGTDLYSRALFFTSQNVGFTVGSDGTTATHYIYRTTDGGTTWSIVKSGSPASMYGIHFLDANTGYAVRSNTTSSEVYKTLDGGTSWGMLSGSSSSTWMKHILAVDANKAFCVGVSGTIKKTTDGGTTWSTMIFGSYELTDIVFPSTTTGYISGFGGTVLKTTDGGISWSALTISSSANFYSLAFLDVNRGFVVGQNGAIFYTSDGGVSWTNQSGCTSNTLVSVRFLNQNLGYACGASGTIVKYTNTIGVEEIGNELYFSVFPNPSNGLFSVKINSGISENIDLCIYNTIGQIVFVERGIKFSGTYSRQIDLSSFDNGIYFIKFTNRAKSTVKKIVITR